jgi:dephospho-CoA kinase
MIVLGVTGGIATGKTTLVRLMKRPGIRIFDADQVFHQQVMQQAAVRLFIQQHCRGMPIKHWLQQDPQNWQAWNGLVHPRIVAQCIAFIEQCRRLRVGLCVLDIPLLFEVGLAVLCDQVIVTRAPDFLVSQRLRRRGMHPEDTAMLAAIRRRQLTQRLRSKSADVCVLTSAGWVLTRRQLAQAQQVFKPKECSQ